jgi:hypothetical protein
MSNVVGSFVGRSIGRLRIVRLVGEGGMGSVYEAEHETLPQRFAVKILRADIERDARFVERFRREAIAASRVDHPNIVRITDFGRLDSGEHYLVMEFIEGELLDSMIRRSAPIGLSRAVPILIQVADALDAAHEADVVHRDLKPENVLLYTLRGQPDVVKVFDFGIAKMRSAAVSSRLTMQGQIFGTAEYVSPEQASDKEVDGRSDLYSLGVLAFEVTTGSPPFEGPGADVLVAHLQRPAPPPSSRVPGGAIPAAFDAIVLRCLAKKPADRYQTAAEVRRDLVRVRGLLIGLSDGMLRASDRAPKIDPASASVGWRALAKAPSDALIGGATDGDRPRPAPARLLRGSEDVRRRLHELLRQIAIGFTEVHVRPPELNDALAALLVIEEELASMGGRIALAEQNFERIRFESGERETTLQHALVDLTLDRSRLLESQADPGRLADLDFQIRELEQRVQQLTKERQGRISKLAGEVATLRKQRAEREREAAARYHKLGEVVDQLRDRAGGKLTEQYAALDELRAALKQARATLPPTGMAPLKG